MAKLWRYLYYKGYTIGANKIDPEFAIAILMTMIFFLGILTLRNIVALALNQYNILATKDERWGLIIVSLLFQYFVFLKNARYKKILKEFQNETKTESVLGFILLAVTIIVSGSLYILTDSFYAHLAH